MMSFFSLLPPLSSLWVPLVGLVIVVAIVVIVVVLVRRLQGHGRLLRSLNMTLFLVLLPYEGEDEERNAEMVREKIGAAEQLYTALAKTLESQSVWKRFWYGPTVAALEIATRGEEIAFYMAIPRRLKSVVEKNIYAAYPNAEIEEADDYTLFEPGATARFSVGRMDLPSLLPLRTYQQLERDPLNSITNVMHEVSDQAGEGAAVQIILWPAVGWGSRGERVASLMRKKGMSFDAARDHATRSALGGLFSASPPSQEKDKDREELSPQDQERLEAVSAKAAKPAFYANVRLVAAASEPDRADEILDHLEGGFGQFASPSFNSFTFRRVSGRTPVRDFVFRVPHDNDAIILNTEELASLYHFPLPSTETPSIRRLEAKAAPPPPDLPEEGVLVLGRNMFRGEERVVSFASRADRRRHLYTIGQTGTGKSGFLQNMIAQDVRNGEGVGVVDPHGDLVEAIMGLIPEERMDDVVYFDPSDTDRPVGLNMLEYRTEEQKDFAVQEMIAIFEKLFPPEYIGPMFEHYMRNAMLLLMADQESPGTLIEIPRVFTDDSFVNYKLQSVTDPVVRNFWEKEWKQTTGQQRSEMLGYLVSKIGRFAENEMMRNIIGQPTSGFDVRTIMDEGKILLVNLSKGKTGEINSSLLGLVIVSKIQMAALGRASTPEEQRRDFYLYVDEFQNFTTDSIATILSEARKYRLVLTLAHQFIAQLEESIRDAVFGNIGTMASFRVGPEDAEIMEKHFQPVFSAHDLMRLDNFNAYCRLMFNGKTTRPFSFMTYEPEEGDEGNIATLQAQSRERHGRDKSVVSQEIVERSQLGGTSSDPDMQGMGNKG